MIVTRLACIANKLTSPNNPTIKFSAASCKAAIAVDWKRTCTEGVPGPSGCIRYSWGNLPYQLLKWSPFDEIFSGSLIPSNFSQS